MPSTTLRALLFTAAVLPWPDQGEAQSLHPDLELAARYAPILWPAPDEPFYPTLPHATAFDGIDNDGDRDIDFADLDEVSFGLQPNAEGLIKAWYGLSRRPPPVVLVNESVPLNETLRLKCPPRDAMSFAVFQFWFYYFVDQGPGAHRHDAEHAFVFIDDSRSGSSREPGASDSLEAPKGIVGAGHEESTPNNILVSSRCRNENYIFPKQLPLHVPLLIELGKHASAPDLEMNGRYDPGVDTNLFIESAWGSRDSVGTRFGELDLGGFQTWQSFQRRPEDIIVEEHASSDPGYGPYRSAVSSASHTYRLFPVADLLQLYRLIDEGSKESVQTFLTVHSSCFWGRQSGEVVEISDEAFDRMRQWTRGKSNAQVILKHNDLRDPNRVFKLHLYPRWGVFLGATVEQDLADFSQPYLHAGVQISEIQLPNWDFLRLFGVAGARLFNNGALELSGAWSGKSPRYYGFRSATAVAKLWRGRRTGPFVGMVLRRDRPVQGNELSDDDVQDIVDETGVTEETVRLQQFETKLDVALTGGFGITQWLPWIGSSLDVRFGIVIEPTKGTSSDLERAFGRKAGLRFQFTTRLAWGIVQPRHPLTY